MTTRATDRNQPVDCGAGEALVGAAVVGGADGGGESLGEPDAGGGQPGGLNSITFQAPLGPLGWIAERVLLSWYVPHLIRRRNRYLKTSLER